MKCLHCAVEFHEDRKIIEVGTDADSSWHILSSHCPACKRLNLFLVAGNQMFLTDTPNVYEISPGAKLPIRPLASSRICPSDVPESIRGDFLEASATLPVSAKASAALSRRCLQNLLRNAAEVKHADLAKEIQEVLDQGNLPSHIAAIIDAVRNIGNFAAHPIKAKNTGEIFPVEPQEAEWNLDVLEQLFDFYYVQPAIIAKKRAALNDKLNEAGKPPMK